MYNVKDLSGIHLDIAVCIAHGWSVDVANKTIQKEGCVCSLSELDFHKNWGLAGELMEREHVFPIRMSFEDNKKYLAKTNERTQRVHDLTFVAFGETAIECVLRCYVGHRLGSKIELPL